MASLSSTHTSSTSNHRHCQCLPPPNSPSPRFLLPFPSPHTLPAFLPRISNPQFRPHSSFVAASHPPSTRRIRCFRPDSAPPSDPPPPPANVESFSGALSRMQDTVQIFFAVFFWMALFFWGSAWDGRDGGGKHNKGNRFKR